MGRDVFVSHASSDAPIAAAVCAGLEQRGLGCWIAPRDIDSGRPWGASIVHGLDECRVLLLVLTARSNASRHVVREVERADGKGARILTFRVEAVALEPTLEYFLSADHWFDATSGPVQGRLPALAEAVRALLDAAPAPARAPVATRPAPPSERELVRAFDELAPDDWSSKPRGGLGRFLKNLFDDR